MAFIDEKSQCLSIRIVFDGAAEAGKTSTVTALAASFGEEVVAPGVGEDGRTPYFDWAEYTAGRFGGRPIRCELVTVPGQHALMERRRVILSTADAVVFVADTTQAALSHSRQAFAECVDFVSELSPPPGILVQANKQDIGDSLGISELFSAHRDAEEFKTVSTTASEGSGVREVFIYAVRLALERVRALDALGQLTSTVPPIDSPDSLYATINTATTATDGDASPAETPGAADREPSDKSRDPFANVPAGSIWPPLEGRLILQEARAQSVDWRLKANGTTVGIGDSWMFETSRSHTFSTSEDARKHLNVLARKHTNSREHLGSERCLVALPTGRPGWQVWQVVPRQESVRDQLERQLANPHGVADVAQKIVNCWETTRAHLRTLESCPVPLHLTLDSLGTDRDGAPFVGVLRTRASDVTYHDVKRIIQDEFRSLFSSLCKHHGADELTQAVESLRESMTRAH